MGPADRAAVRVVRIEDTVVGTDVYGWTATRNARHRRGGVDVCARRGCPCGCSRARPDRGHVPVRLSGVKMPERDGGRSVEEFAPAGRPDPPPAAGMDRRG